MDTSDIYYYFLIFLILLKLIIVYIYERIVNKKTN